MYLNFLSILSLHLLAIRNMLVPFSHTKVLLMYKSNFFLSRIIGQRFFIQVSATCECCILARFRGISRSNRMNVSPIRDLHYQ